MDAAWVQVGLNTAYVVATIAIWWATHNSVKSTQKQTEELIRQFQETNRARLVVRFDRYFDLGRSFVVKNIGLRPATDVRVTLDDAFMAALEKEFPDNDKLKHSLQSCILIAPGQEYWFLSGMCSSLDKMPTPVAHIRITYRDGEKNYTEEAVIDFSQYDCLRPGHETTVVGKNG